MKATKNNLAFLSLGDENGDINDDESKNNSLNNNNNNNNVETTTGSTVLVVHLQHNSGH